MKAKLYKDYLLKHLQDPERAAGYLTECYKLGEAEFLIALRDVVEAHGGIGQISKAARLNRENLYRLLSHGGNPTLASLNTILAVLGLKLEFAPDKKAP
ncbi:MAG TPA: transcriptional regulator [Verrucomicrobiae bacterium]|jgi:probable addiction module antidote protein